MDTIRLVIVTAIISLPLYQGVVGDLRQKPENAAGIVGSSIVLRCQGASDSSRLVTWQHFSPESADPIDIAIDGDIGDSPNKNFYNISGDASIKEYNLVINLQLVVAGRYRCYELFGTPAPSNLAHVTVLASDPSCVTNVENNVISEGYNITFSCELNYGSGTIDWAPTIEWSENNQPIQDVIDASVPFVKVNVSYEVPASRELNGSEFSASIKFTAFESPEDHATNIPKYHYDESFGPFTVYYGASNIALINGKGMYCPGDIVTCIADGNPEVKYRWHNRVENTTQEGAVLDITDKMKDKQYEFRCFAYNNIGDQEHMVSEDIAFEVKCPSGLSVGAYIGIGCAVVVVVVGIGVGVYMLVIKKKKTHAMK